MSQATAHFDLTRYPRAAMPVEPVFRLTVEQYHEMVHRGTLTEDDPVELLEGVLVFKMPKNRPHLIVTRRVDHQLAAIVGVNWHTEREACLQLKDSVPEPDVMLVRGRDADYGTHPGPDDVAIVLEVSDTTLRKDRGVKLRSYARARIGTYWIVNLINQSVEVYTDPTGQAPEPTYRNRAVHPIGERVPVIVDGVEVGAVDVAAIFEGVAPFDPNAA